jgi:hypothetical protein
MAGATMKTFGPRWRLRVVNAPYPSGVRRHTRVSSGPEEIEASDEFGEQKELIAPEHGRR